MNRKYRHLSREERYEIKRQNLRYVIANMLKTLITQQCFIVKHFIISLNSWALYQT